MLAPRRNGGLLLSSGIRTLLAISRDEEADLLKLCHLVLVSFLVILSDLLERRSLLSSELLPPGSSNLGYLCQLEAHALLNNVLVDGSSEPNERSSRFLGQTRHALILFLLVLQETQVWFGFRRC